MIKLILFLLISVPLHAKELLIRAPQVDNENFLVFLERHPQYESLEQRWLFQLKNHQKSLEKLYLKAQYEFLNGSPEVAKKLFKEVTDQSLSSPWMGDARKLISISFLRLAQLEPENNNGWVQRAEIFDNHYPPDHLLFPPNLQKIWMESKIRNQEENWYPDWPHGVLDKIIINGKMLSYTPFTNYPLHPLHNHITLVSNTGFIISKTGTAREIKNFQWHFPRPAQGSCSDHNFSFEFKWEDTSVLFPEKCVIKSQTTLPDFQPESVVAKAIDQQNPTEKLVSPQWTPRQNYSPWYKNKWVWMGLASLAGYYFYENNKRADHSALNTQVKIKPSQAVSY